MSYTLNYTGSEIDDILDRAAPGGAIDQALATKQDVLTFDDAPTSGSDNPVKSGGIYDAIQAGGAAALAAFPTDSVSGDVVSFPDGADGIPVKSFIGSIIPVQDLHGQSYPWPSGGGKNKVDADVSYTAYKISDNTYQATASDFYAIKIAVPNSLIGVECTFSAYLSPNASTSGFRAQAISGSDTFNGNTIPGGTSGWSSVTFTPASGVTNLVTYTYSSGGGQTATVKEVQLEVGSSRTTFAPYSNICPISGWTGANIYRTGVNVWDEEWENGYYDSGTPASGAGIRSKAANYIGVKPNTTYYCKCGVSANIAMSYYDASQAYISNYVVSGGSGTFTTPSNCFYLRFHVASGYGATYNHDISINYPATDTTYQPYNGSTILLDFGQTVYAGTLTALGGGLWSVQSVFGDVDMGDLAWTKQSGYSDVFYATIPSIKSGTRNVITESYTQIQSGTLSNGQFLMNGNVSIYVKNSAYSDAATFQAAMTGQKIVYELATLPDPIIVSASDLATLLGSNSIWTDVGAVTGMTYRADTALYIQKLLNGGGTLQTLSMASPSPSLSLGRVGVLAEQEVSEPEQTDEEAEQLEQTEERVTVLEEARQ